ncbi:hypothetical protein ACSZME_19055 [Aeromonas dhakensis]
MDIEYFFKERINFAKRFHTVGSEPFTKIMELIENEQPPYEPVYNESGEPQFLCEWLEARDGLESIGLATISMLSSSLQLYMNEWLNRIEKSNSRFNRKGSKGWFNALKNCMQAEGVDFSSCPANLNAIEQLVLARNRTQHAEDITSNSVTHLSKELSKFPSPLFVDPQDSALKNNWFGQPRVYVGAVQVNTIADELEKFSGWLEHGHWREHA